MLKMLIFALYVKTDHKLTVVNKVTRNLFLYSNLKVSTTKSQKKNILTFTKE